MEQWKPVERFIGYYEVSTQGRVRSLTRKEWTKHSKTGCPVRRLRRGRILSPNKLPLGYYQIRLYKIGVSTTYLIHRLVAEAFIPNPNSLPEVNHLDGDPSNNHIKNLEWCTRRENSLHSTKVLEKNRGEGCGTSKLSESQVLEIARLLGLAKYTLQEIGDMFNVTNHTIFRIKHGHNWSWLTGIKQ